MEGSDRIISETPAYCHTVKPRDLYGALLLTGFLCTYTDKIINLLNLCIYTILVNDFINGIDDVCPVERIKPAVLYGQGETV